MKAIQSKEHKITVYDRIEDMFTDTKADYGTRWLLGKWHVFHHDQTPHDTEAAMHVDASFAVWRDDVGWTGEGHITPYHLMNRIPFACGFEKRQFLVDLDDCNSEERALARANHIAWTAARELGCCVEVIPVCGTVASESCDVEFPKGSACANMKAQQLMGMRATDADATMREEGVMRVPVADAFGQELEARIRQIATESGVTAEAAQSIKVTSGHRMARVHQARAVDGKNDEGHWKAGRK